MTLKNLKKEGVGSGSDPELILSGRAVLLVRPAARRPNFYSDFCVRTPNELLGSPDTRLDSVDKLPVSSRFGSLQFLLETVHALLFRSGHSCPPHFLSVFSGGLGSGNPLIGAGLRSSGRLGQDASQCLMVPPQECACLPAGRQTKNHSLDGWVSICEIDYANLTNHQAMVHPPICEIGCG